MPSTPFFGSGEQFLGSTASFQGPGPLPMASARQAIGISLVESFWRAIGDEIEHFCMISVISGPRMPKELETQPLPPRSGSRGSSECVKINFEFVLTRLTAEEVGGF